MGSRGCDGPPYTSFPLFERFLHTGDFRLQSSIFLFLIYSILSQTQRGASEGHSLSLLGGLLISVYKRIAHITTGTAEHGEDYSTSH